MLKPYVLNSLGGKTRFLNGDPSGVLGGESTVILEFGIYLQDGSRITDFGILPEEKNAAGGPLEWVQGMPFQHPARSVNFSVSRYLPAGVPSHYAIR